MTEPNNVHRTIIYQSTQVGEIKQILKCAAYFQQWHRNKFSPCAFPLARSRKSTHDSEKQDRWNRKKGLVPQKNERELLLINNLAKVRRVWGGGRRNHIMYTAEATSMWSWFVCALYERLTMHTRAATWDSFSPHAELFVKPLSWWCHFKGSLETV